MKDKLRIGITAGHNVYIGKYYDPGATNSSLKITEADIVKETVALLIPMLERQGHIAYDCTPYNQTFTNSYGSHVERCKRVDSYNVDVYLDVHINAGGGTGVEVWVHNMSSKSVPYAIKIAESISKDMNLVNRGVKAKSSFWSVSLTTKPAMIIEGAFIDNKADMEKLTPKKYARSIAKVFGDISNPIEIPTVGGESNMIYKIRKEWVDATTQKGAYSSLENAISTAKSLDGYKVFDNNGKQVYPEVVKKNEHWAKKHYDNLISKGFKFVDTEFDKEMALGNVYKLFDELTNNVDIGEPNNKKEPEIENDVIKILQIEYKRVLKHGMKGEDIRKLQVALVELGYDPKGIDGVFGNGCLASVKTFQRNSGLVVDGLFGLASHNKINELLRRKSDGEAVSSPRIKYEVLRPDSQTTVVKIPHKNIKEIKTIIANNKSKSETLQSMKNRTGVDLIINGGLFYYSDKYKDNHSLNLLVHEGKTIVAGTYSRYSLMTEKDGSYEFGWYSWNKNRVTGIGGSPALIVDGKINLDKGSLDNNIHNSKHPRSAIGMNNTHFFMVVIDGRKPSSNLYGMTNKELAEFMLNKLKCTSAIGFDGGLSSTLIGDNILNKSYTGRGLHNGLGIKLK